LASRSDSGRPDTLDSDALAIILLFFAMALYVGLKFQPLPAEELDALVEEVERDD
jgi:hypothetical protein